MNYRLTIKTNEDFEAEIFYKDVSAEGESLGVDLEDYTIKWVVTHYNTDTEEVEILIPDTDYTLANSNLGLGYILIEMNATQTGNIPVENTTNQYWSLYAENDAEDSRLHIASGPIKLLNWIVPGA